jgi:hypothetical protein
MSVFLASVILFMGVLYNYFSNVQRTQLKMETELASQGVSEEGLDYFDGLDIADNFRITWIDADGTVLFDSKSDSNEMENHLEREEIQQALKEGIGESSRYSATLMERSFYCAKRLQDKTVLRLSVAQNTILTLMLGMAQPICIIFVIAIVLSLVLASRSANKIAGLLTGLGITAVIQSSSATTVMVVGFVNSGLMTLKQAINVIMGANIGTTVTAWILSLAGIDSGNIFVKLLKPASFTPVLAMIGIILYMFCKNDKKKDTGMIDTTDNRLYVRYI